MRPAAVVGQPQTAFVIAAAPWIRKVIARTLAVKVHLRSAERTAMGGDAVAGWSIYGREHVRRRTQRTKPTE